MMQVVAESLLGRLSWGSMGIVLIGRVTLRGMRMATTVVAGRLLCAGGVAMTCLIYAWGILAEKHVS